MTRRRTGWMLLIAANVLCYCVLSFYRATDAAPRDTMPRLANPAADRLETIALLGEIKELLKEQNDLLRSGTLKVVICDPERR